jgi:hypothetical protein
LSEEEIAKARRAHADRELFRQRMVAKNTKDQAPVVAALRRDGYAVSRIHDLRGLGIDYSQAVPLLLEWLDVMENRDIKEELVRTLSRKWARPQAAKPFIRHFRSTHDETLKWAIGNGLEIVGDDSVFDELVELAQDRSHGTARQMVVIGLGNMRENRAKAAEVLVGLLDDEQVNGHALIGLRRLGVSSSRPHVEPFLASPETWKRNEAKKAIAKFDRLAAGKKR